MSKDPAFLFYPNDYIGGTMGMTFEEKGAYMELLMMQFNRGHMTIHMIGQTIGQLWDTVKDKFIQDSKGLWYNKRLEEEQMKRKQFTDSRKNNLLGKNQYTDKGGHKTKLMEDEDENKNVIANEKNKEIFNKFRIIYPGTKRGIDTEFNNFIKKHKDWKEVLPLLLITVENQIKYRENTAPGTFIPQWKNLQTWINQRCWEEEYEENKIYRDKNGMKMDKDGNPKGGVVLI